MFNEKVEEIEKELREVALVMLEFKKGISISIDTISDFQVTLAECLYKAMSIYNDISKKEKDYIKIKKSLETGAFSEKMKNWKKQKFEIKELINTGKSLGDALAYMFYRDSIEELEKHYEHSDNGLFVSGIGGIGEIEFIKANPTINGYLVLYHSITNMLRIGDFSLCSLTGKVVGIGEIKSVYKSEESKFVSSIYMSSRVKLDIEAEDGEEIYGKSTKEKVKTQIEKQNTLLMSNFGNIIKDKRKMDTQDFLIMMACNNEKGIVYNENKDTMVMTITEEEYEASKDIDDLLGAKIDNMANNLMKNSLYNCIRMSQIGKVYKPYRKPIVWWNLDDDIIINVLFNKSMIFSVVNLASYYEHLIANGFYVEIREDEIVVGKRCGKHYINLKAFEMIEDLMVHELYMREDIAEMANSIVENVQNKCDRETIVRISIKRNF